MVPPLWLSGHTSGHSVPRCALTATTAAPLILLDHAASKNSAAWFQVLAGDFQTELLDTSKRGQVRTCEGSVRHVEVFQMESVRTSIIGRPRPLSAQRHANQHYTLKCEEPHLSPSIVICCSGNGSEIPPRPVSRLLRSVPTSSSRANIAGAVPLPMWSCTPT